MNETEYVHMLRYLEGRKKYYKALDRALPFIAAFIYWSMDYKRTAPMTVVYTGYGEIGANFTSKIGHRYKMRTS